MLVVTMCAVLRIAFIFRSFHKPGRMFWVLGFSGSGLRMQSACRSAGIGSPPPGEWAGIGCDGHTFGRFLCDFDMRF